jgi:hypothetical protein
MRWFPFSPRTGIGGGMVLIKLSPGRGALLSGLFRFFDEFHGQFQYPRVFEFDSAAIGAWL